MISKLPTGVCTICGRRVPIKRGGVLREHLRPGRGAKRPCFNNSYILSSRNPGGPNEDDCYGGEHCATHRGA